VAAALDGVRRTYFGLSVSPDHLLAATIVATVAKAHGELDVLVDMSQMTVSQTTATSTAESHHQRLHWLAEQVLDWSGLHRATAGPRGARCSAVFGGGAGSRWLTGRGRGCVRPRPTVGRDFPVIDLLTSARHVLGEPLLPPARPRRTSAVPAG
jgi:hypothetical protein